MSILKNLKARWHNTINQIDKSEYIWGGADGNMNQAPRQLAENDLYLKQQIENINTNFKCLKEQNGYTKLPNGMMMQWGDVDLNDNALSFAYTLTFPQSFANACLSFQAIRKVATAETLNGDGGVLLHSLAKDKANLSIQIFEGGDKDDLRGFSWFAIGY